MEKQFTNSQSKKNITMKQIDSSKCKELAKRLEEVRNEIWDLIGDYDEFEGNKLLESIDSDSLQITEFVGRLIYLAVLNESEDE